MFTVNDDLSIYLTRGDTLFFNVRANDHGYPYTFKPGDIVRISVTAKKDVTDVYIQKDFPVCEASKTVFVYLEGRETKIGDKISKYRDYWYEIVLNPDTVPQTIIGNNDDGPKIFRLFPEADDVEEEEILPEKIPVVDDELDLVSDRPVSNRAVASAVARLTAAIEQLKGNVPDIEEPDGSVFNAMGQVEGLAMLAIDAYGVAVKNGFNGTAKEWLASLKGDPFVYEDFTDEQLEALKVKGDKGDTGRGIVSIERTDGSGVAGTFDTYTITFTDDTTSTFKVYNGANGSGGGPGGGSGATFFPHVDADGNLSWTNDMALENPEPVNIKGEKGDKGDSIKGDKGDSGGDGVSATHRWDGTTLIVTSASGTSSADLKGEKGDKGDNGQSIKGDRGDNGYSPVRGTDYWTAADIAEIKSYVDNAILGGAW